VSLLERTPEHLEKCREAIATDQTIAELRWKLRGRSVPGTSKNDGT
jgi:hypothetical protein